ncbi:unnamed protein product [Cladocopium goreaui]|uniref:Retrovirus-related Pol polyprotein from transposon RE1 (Retro element 1) (AtRE1) n=1 Tax=Cladocopium goreaui TaxID=2562237 RepID=A0A9P1FF26_9DINO|nr:unnamed protein product [Cladocopium goreaui]
MDYFFLSPEKEEEVEDESRLVTILCLTDTVTGWPLALQLPNKSTEVAQSRYCLQNVDLYLKNLGYNKVILQHDGEPSISFNQKRYPSLDVSSNLTPRLVRHAAWLIARFHVKGKDGLTPYRLTTGNDYSHPVLTLPKYEQILSQDLWTRGYVLDVADGYYCPKLRRRLTSMEIGRLQGLPKTIITAMLRESNNLSLPKRSFEEAVRDAMNVNVPQTMLRRGKMQRRWIKGIWLGKLDRDDSNVLGTSSGAIAVRSVRRLPKESQTSQELMNDMKGIPWQPRDGMRHKINRELSQPVALPAPAAAGPTALASEPPEKEHPTLAEDGQNVNQDGLVVQAAAQLEDLLGDQAEDFPAGIPTDDDDALSWAPRQQNLKLQILRRQQGRAGSLRPSEVRDGHRGKRVRDDQAALAPGQAEAKQSRQAGVLQHLTNHEIWSHIQEWTNSEDKSNPMALQRIANVTDFVDQLLDPEEVTKARKVQLQKLWERGAYKSRFTCADVKARYTAAEEEGLDVFVPTPTPEAHNLLEVYALTKGYYARSLDIVAAFLIGADRGASEGKHVYMRAPVEWHDTFLENELEEILCSKVDPQRYAFSRGEKDPCVFRRDKSGIILIHHINDICMAGPKEAVNHLVEVEMPKHCEVQAGELESEGTAVEYLGRTKVRTKDAIITIPDEKHIKAVIAAAGISSEVPSKQLNLLETEPLGEADAKLYRSAVGSAIYLSLDRREIQYAVKEAARHMSQPRKCDMQAVKTLAAYLQSHPHVGRITTCDPDCSSEWPCELFSDSDWAGCRETRRSTDCYIAVVCGAIVACGTQTQPGLPATSSPDAELRGVSRAAREAIFLKELITRDFGQQRKAPPIDGQFIGMQASKRIGPGSKLRHLEVCEFYVQGALQSKQIALGKVKGTVNCANFLTKHPKSGTEVRV